jgi:hypothetical protein
MTNSRLLLCFVLTAFACRADGPAPLQPPKVPVELLVNDNEQVVFMAHAKGDQIYACKANANGEEYGWVLKAPDATLTDDSGKVVGHHVIGPTWQWEDGSHTRGKVVTSARSPDPDSIPWLLLSAFERSDEGALSRLTSIQRVNTKGGRAPATGCDGAHVNTEVRVPYTADYYFYKRTPQPPAK